MHFTSLHRFLAFSSFLTILSGGYMQYEILAAITATFTSQQEEG